MRVAVAVNPAAGSGYAAGAGATAASQLSAAGYSVEWLAGESWEVLRRRVKAAVRGGADALVMVVGGDGMVHLGANVLAERAVSLGIVAREPAMMSRGHSGFPCVGLRPLPK